MSDIVPWPNLCLSSKTDKENLLDYILLNIDFF